MPPQITVLMPVRDGARWIAEAIGSVLGQSFQEFELVIVDDGSQDQTPAIITGFASRDPRIIWISQPPSGLIAALNAGLDVARAPLIARLDADDVAEPQRLAKQHAAMQRDPGLVLLGTWATEIDATGRPVGLRRPEANPGKLNKRLASGNPMIHASSMFRTGSARAVGNYRAAFAAAEDYDLWLRLSECGRVANLPETLIQYRVHAASISAREPLQQMFANRLAQRSALLRKLGKHDPLANREQPLLVADESPKAYADIAQLYRALSSGQAGDISELTRLERGRMSRRERAVAQEALSRAFAADRRSISATGLWKLIRLRPSRALPLLWLLWSQNKSGET